MIPRGIGRHGETRPRSRQTAEVCAQKPRRAGTDGTHTSREMKRHGTTSRDSRWRAAHSGTVSRGHARHESWSGDFHGYSKGFCARAPSQPNPCAAHQRSAAPGRGVLVASAVGFRLSAAAASPHAMRAATPRVLCRRADGRRGSCLPRSPDPATWHSRCRATAPCGSVGRVFGGPAGAPARRLLP